MARYRDSKTGRFVSKSTWKRSHAQTGKSRFVRETEPKRSTSKGATRKQRPSVPRREREPIREWIIGFKYKNRRAFDVIVTARTEEQAQDVAIEFLASDRNGRRIIESGMKNWDMRIARARETRREEGQAEYRNKRR